MLVFFVALANAIQFFSAPYNMKLVQTVYGVTILTDLQVSAAGAVVATTSLENYYSNGTETVTIVSDNSTLGGTMGWVVDPMQNFTSQSCHYTYNSSLALLFDFSSSGWLSRANVSTVGYLTIYSYDCSPFCLSSGGFASYYTYFGAGFYQLGVDEHGNYLYLNLPNSQGPLLFEQLPKPLSSPFNYSVPSVCTASDRCAANATQTKITLYRNHGNTTLFKSLDNVNLADAQGEVYWLCDYNAPSPLISQFELTVSPAWTEYMLCNGGQCAPSSYSSILGIGKQNNDGTDKCTVAGMSNTTCSPSCSGVGTWYSFPQLGRCPPNKPIGTNNCTWLNKYTTVKSITVDCLQRVSKRNFTCDGQTVVSLVKQFLDAFKKCPDVQFQMTSYEEELLVVPQFSGAGMPRLQEAREAREIRQHRRQDQY